MIDGVEFDGFRDGALLEAKGPGYRAFFDASGEPKPWYEASGKLKELRQQVQRQAKMAERVGLKLRWHVAERDVGEFLRRLFEKWDIFNIEIVYTPPMP